MTDRELLELAAKAIGEKITWCLTPNGYTDSRIGAVANGWDVPSDHSRTWNPLTDDGDALRLAVKLQIDVDNDHPECCVVPEPQTIEYYKDNSDPYAATRRAIVRAAAEIGKGQG